MSEDRWLKFGQSLDEHHQWPCCYVFKFIVARESAQAVLDLFPGIETGQRPSSSGQYVSVTAEATMSCAAEVVAIYRRAADIPGIVSL